MSQTALLHSSALSPSALSPSALSPILASTSTQALALGSVLMQSSQPRVSSHNRFAQRLSLTLITRYRSLFISLFISLFVSLFAAQSSPVYAADDSVEAEGALLEMFKDQNPTWSTATPPFVKGLEKSILSEESVKFTTLMSVTPDVPISLIFNLRSSISKLQYTLECDQLTLLTGETVSGATQKLTLNVDHTSASPLLNCTLLFTNPTGQVEWANIESVTVAYTKSERAKSDGACEWGELSYYEHNGLQTRGNGDNKLSPFELIEVRLPIKLKDTKEVKVKVTLSENDQVALLNGGSLKPDPDNPHLMMYHAIITPKLFAHAQSATEVSLPITLSCAQPARRVFTIPYQHSLGDTLELQRVASVTKPFNFKSDIEIDSFLTRYPSSDHAGVMFNLRQKLLQERAQRSDSDEALLGVINDYHSFIQRYPDRVGAQVAVHDVYGLYRRRDTLNGYIDFLHRYPESVDATLADARIKEITFKQLRVADEIEGYDYYLSIYPHAEPYATLAETRAEELSHSIEESFIAALPNTDADYLLRRAKMQDRAAHILKEWLQNTNLKPTARDARVAQARIKRGERLIERHYSETPYYQNLMLSKQITRVQEAISHLSDQLREQQRMITQRLEGNFKRLRDELSDQFSDTQRALTHIETRLKTQETNQRETAQRQRELSGLIDTYYIQLQRDSGEIKRELKSAQRLELFGAALEIGVSAYDLYQTARRSPDRHFHFNPDVRLEFNRRERGPSATARLLTGGACAGAAHWITGLSAPMIGPLAPLAGGATALGCKWGLGKLMR